MSAVTSSPAARAASMRSTAPSISGQFGGPPDAFRWYTSAPAPERRAISMLSSIAPSSPAPSDRMWAM